eukprot:6194530-Pleurochrysis_carterae.AAC.1
MKGIKQFADARDTHRHIAVTRAGSCTCDQTSRPLKVKPQLLIRVSVEATASIERSDALSREFSISVVVAPSSTLQRSQGFTLSRQAILAAPRTSKEAPSAVLARAMAVMESRETCLVALMRWNTIDEA